MSVSLALILRQRRYSVNRKPQIIGLISDTHGLLRPEALRALEGSDLIIHAGDVGNAKIISSLQALAPVSGVRGNIDTEPWALALPLTGTCLLMVANDFRKKGLTTALQALAQLPVNHVLAVVGNPAQAHEFQDQIKRLNLVKRVFFLGRLHDVTEAYRAANYLVHPTREDTFAMVVLEAMAFRLPVVVSGPQFCGISGLLQHHFDAWLLDDPTDVEALVCAIRTLNTDQVLRVTMAANAALFANGYEWKGIAAKQEAVYRMACAC